MIPQDQRLSAAEAAQVLGTHVTTFTRWANTGYRGVRVDVEWIGNRVFTTRAAIDAFVAKINADRVNVKPRRRKRKGVKIAS